MPEQTLTCRDCGNGFAFSEGEQEFFAQRGFNPPVRCADCRQAKKQQQFRQRDSRGGRYENNNRKRTA